MPGVPIASLALVVSCVTACSSDTKPHSHKRVSRSDLSSASPSAAALGPASSEPAGAPSASEAPVDPALASQVVVPPELDHGPHPFVLFLHGLGGTGASFSSALDIPRLARDKRFAYAVPDGAPGPKGRFWNASSSCCDFEHTGVDHVASLGALIATARRLPSVDPSRVFVIGFSNGAFMAHRLGCSIPGIAAIVSVAGSAPNDGDPPCAPRAPVAILEIHGDQDTAVPFEGGHVLKNEALPVHRSAFGTVGLWSSIDGCASGPVEKGRLDLMASIPGAETIDLRYEGCKAPVALWRVAGGDHFIAASRQALDAVFVFLDSVPKGP